MLTALSFRRYLVEILQFSLATIVMMPPWRTPEGSLVFWCWAWMPAMSGEWWVLEWKVWLIEIAVAILLLSLAYAARKSSR